MIIVPKDKEDWLDSLHRLKILDMPREERFDLVTRLARQVFNVSSCAICFTDGTRRWIKSAQGINSSETPREDISLCSYVFTNE